MPREAWDITREMFLSLEETERMLRYLDRAVQTADAATRATASTDRVLSAGLLFSGLRNSECCGLRLGDTGVVTGRSSLVVGTTPRQDREVVIPAPVNQLIAQYCRDVRPNCCQRVWTRAIPISH